MKRHTITVLESSEASLSELLQSGRKPHPTQSVSAIRKSLPLLGKTGPIFFSEVGLCFVP
jgi:hypothetical protein